MSKVTLNNYDKFESIKHFNRKNYEYWEARELRIALDYYEWRNFISVLDKAMDECRKNNRKVENNFIKCNKILHFNQKVVDYKLSRYACFLICKNGFDKKQSVLDGREYFKNCK